MTGCGASVQALDEADRAGLHAHVQQVRAAAAADDPATARAAVAAFRADVRRLLADGRIDPADAQALLTEAAAVAAGLPDGPAAEPAKETQEKRQAQARETVRRQPRTDDAERALRDLRERLTRDLADWREHRGKGKGGKHRGWKHDDRD